MKERRKLSLVESAGEYKQKNQNEFSQLRERKELFSQPRRVTCLPTVTS